MDVEDKQSDSSMTLPCGRINVLLPIPVSQYYEYLNEDLSLRIGDLVEVPFGKRYLPAVVIGSVEGQVEVSKLKRVLSKYDLPRIPEEMMNFVVWVSAYNMVSAGSVLKMVLSAPQALLPPRRIKAFVNAFDMQKQGVKLTPGRKRVLDYLADNKTRTVQEIIEFARVTPAIIRGLQRSGLIDSVAIAEKNLIETHKTKKVVTPVFNLEQGKAVSKLLNSLREQTFNVSLIDGVTGAGKTEVYFEAISEVLKQEKQVLILLPEIALSQPFLTRFETRFGFRPGQWHSDLSGKIRNQTWRAVFEGEVSVVVGARSALFLPFSKLGLIVVDEEHETGFKQADGVKYQCRDMAVARARAGQFSAVLVSATPSLETLINFEQGRYNRIPLKSRYGAADLPEVKAIDLGKSNLIKGQWITKRLVDEISETLERKEQTILFLNRRGYAPLNLCRACGHRLECPNCSAWLVEHKSISRLQCHHCDYAITMPSSCFKCGAIDSFHAVGPGVERLEEEVRFRFPSARISVASSDTLSGPVRLGEFIKAVQDSKIDIIIGTQVIAKGHHFPLVTCVGVIDADLGLAGGDLRAGERTYQLLHQVAGRSGRESRPGKVFLQTSQPDHPLIKALLSWDRDGFLEEEKRGRRECGYASLWEISCGNIKC
jgi:primosomal protein N' (replication factor Y)